MYQTKELYDAKKETEIEADIHKSTVITVQFNTSFLTVATITVHKVIKHKHIEELNNTSYNIPLDMNRIHMFFQVPMTHLHQDRLYAGT